MPHIVILHHDVAFGIDDFGPESQEERADGVDGVARLAKTDAERNAALMAGLCRLEERVRRPVVRLGRAACRIHLLHVDAGVLLHQVDARARPLDLAADTSGNGEPFVAGLAEILDGAINGAILLDERFDNVVHRLKQFGLRVRPPRRHRAEWPHPLRRA